MSRKINKNKRVKNINLKGDNGKYKNICFKQKLDRFKSY